MQRDAELTYVIRASVFEVHGTLGPGFLERVYERVLLKELSERGVRAEAQVPITVRYKGEAVGEYFADVLVENRVLVELKAQEHLTSANDAQVSNYLKATGVQVGLLVDFGRSSALIRRFVV